MHNQSGFKNGQKGEIPVRKGGVNMTNNIKVRPQASPQLAITKKSIPVARGNGASTKRQWQGSFGRINNENKDALNKRGAIERGTYQHPRVENKGSILDKYNRPKQQFAVSRSKTSVYKRAPLNQFKCFLADSENIFWENSPIVRRLRLCQYVKLCLIILFLIMTATYLLIGRIQPWPKGQCPRYAECGVFIHCRKGYILENNLCIIDPSLTHRANKIYMAVVQQLKLDYGARDCQKGFSEVPTKQTHEVFGEFGIKDQLLQRQIQSCFNNNDNQVENKFLYKEKVITPTEKLYSLSCQMQLFTESRDFYWVIVLFLLASMGAGYVVSYLLFKRKAKMAYEYLRDKAQYAESVLIQEHKAEIRRLADGWTEQLWLQIDRLRFEQRRIVYFQQNDQLYWKVYREF